MATVTIKVGTLRGKTVKNQTYTVVKDYQVGASSGEGFFTIDATSIFGTPTSRLYVKPNNYTLNGVAPAPTGVKKSVKARQEAAASRNISIVSTLEDESIPDPETNETDEEIVARGRKRFDVLNKLTLGARRGHIRALFVTGAPGIGKTFGVEKTLEEAGMIEQFGAEAPRFEIVSGTMSDVGLYMKLYEHSDPDHVVVFDDCDDIFGDPNSLNLLKAACDTSAKRKIYYNLDSKLLRKKGIPNDFEFKGSVIFISNINFRKVRGAQTRAHLSALMSRAHFLDLTIHSTRERILRIKDLVDNSDMLEKFRLSAKAKKEMLAYFYENAKNFNTLDLRTVIKLAGLVKSADEDRAEWVEQANMSLIGNPLHYEV